VVFTFGAVPLTVPFPAFDENDPNGDDCMDNITALSEYAETLKLKKVSLVTVPRLVPVVHVGGSGLFDFP